MCGIAGLIALDQTHNNLSETAERMMDAIEHRGPDDHGCYIDRHERTVLVHRRLAIHDLTEAGKQPMTSRSQRYTVVFNGEIYNFKKLAVELEHLGHVFRGHSDTEVLLAAVDEWGLRNAVKRFIGMFAFALWDAREKVLHICRDRMGEKPIYYGWIGRNFYFASELKAIESVVSTSRLKIDQQALSSFFQYGYINAPQSIYSGIFKLIPGTYLTVTRDNVKTPCNFSPHTGATKFSPNSYWSLLAVANAGINNQFEREEDAVEELGNLLRDTVSMQKAADVGVGTFLSGGIDSSLVSALAQAESNQSIKTFTIGFNEAEFDESKYAERIAGHLGTDHTTVYMSAQDALDMVPKLAQIYDEPFADSSQIPTCLVSGIARSNVTVCLSGDGGDELFSGYNRYTWSESIWKKIGPVPKSVRKLVAAIIQKPKTEFWDDCYRRFSRKGAVGERDVQRMVGLKLQKLSEFITCASLDEAYQYLSSYWYRPEQILIQRDLANSSESYFDFPNTKEFLEKAMYWDQMNYLPGDNLAKVDRASMAVSLETRLPLLSHQVAELSWRIPKSMKVRDGSSKWVLKEVLYQYVPRELVDRPKMGFSVPIAHWLRNDLFEWASDLLADNRIKETGVLDQKSIRKVWHEHLNGEKDHSLKLWAVLMFMSWHEKSRI